jgi:hypothetical protein
MSLSVRADLAGDGNDVTAELGLAERKVDRVERLCGH